MNALGKIIKLATPSCFAIGLILGTFFLCNFYQSWTPAYWVAAAIVVPPILCLVVDRQDVNRSARSFGCFILRLYWRHIRLAARLWTMTFLAWLLAGITAVSALDRNKRVSSIERGGAETEQFFGFVDGVTAPIQVLWAGLVVLWQIFVLLAVIFFEQLSNWVAAHYIVSAEAAIAVYLMWLVVNTRDLWSEEFPRRTQTAFGRKPL